jgi:hypothetical protein
VDAAIIIVDSMIFDAIIGNIPAVKTNNLLIKSRLYTALKKKYVGNNEITYILKLLV